ncbi:MAG: hypothetical protein HYY18_16130 [Planctomycetes bacterium]|nr:hypothetical protein [Planctomycetota bacterium]
MRGEFTRKFDGEIFGDSDAAKESDEIKRQMDRMAETKVKKTIDTVMELVDKRRKFLYDRFTNITEPQKLDFIGRQLNFKAGGKFKRDAVVEFRVTQTESGQAVQLTFTMEISGKQAKKSDYITISIDHFAPEKVNGFVESKIFDFARAYID